jgi:hypothetical protein
MLNRTTKTRLHIHSIQNAAVPFDKEIAELFREMRQATGLPLEKIASQLQTGDETIRLLEEGHLSALPPWNETNRVILEYTNMLGLDSEPVLRRVMLQLPGDHPKRPKTQVHEPSYDNMRSNVSAIMNRVPGSQAAHENPSLSRQYETPSYVQENRGVPVGVVNPDRELANSGLAARLQAGRNPNADFSPGYGEMRAIPPEFRPPHRKRPSQPVAKNRKISVFVPLMQFVLLLIILGAGYVMWLAVNDPQGFENLKSSVITIWEMLNTWIQELFAS